MSAPLRGVIDANIGIKQFIPDPLSAKVDELLLHLENPQTEFFVPDLFYVESANALWKYVRAGQYPAGQVQAALATLKVLPLKGVATKDLIADAIQISLQYGVSVYDGCYVALSQRVSAPLLTLDARLVNAIAASSFEVYLFTDFIVPSI